MAFVSLAICLKALVSLAICLKGPGVSGYLPKSLGVDGNIPLAKSAWILAILELVSPELLWIFKGF